jgi:hypothetical protein
MGAVDTTYTFTATDTITSSKMNNIIDQTKMTSEAIDGPSLEIIAPGKIRVKALGIGSSELAPNSVTEFKIKNDSVITNKIADLSVTSAKLANNSITGTKLADSTIEASKLNSGQTGTAPIIAARATLQMKKGEWQGSSVDYSSISAAMSIAGSGSPKTVTVTSASDHGFLAGEPFFIWMENPNATLSDQYFCGFVNTVASTTQFTFLTTSTSLLNVTGTIYFVDPTKYSSINIKRVSPGTAVAESGSLSSLRTSFAVFTQANPLFNATFTTELLNADNGVIIGSDNYNIGEVGLKYFNFYSPIYGLLDDGPTYYQRNFSVAVFA